MNPDLQYADVMGVLRLLARVKVCRKYPVLQRHQTQRCLLVPAYLSTGQVTVRAWTSTLARDDRRSQLFPGPFRKDVTLVIILCLTCTRREALWFRLSEALSIYRTTSSCSEAVKIRKSD